MNDRNAPRERLSVPGLNRPRPKNHKPKAWTHQQELSNLRGKEICIFFIDDSYKVGTLVEADQFTLKLAISIAGKENKSVLTFFKSAMKGYGAVADA